MSAEAILLGIAQDGGVPQAGCECDNCRRAWTDPSARQFVACLAVVDHAARLSWLIDATPDFRQQLRALGAMEPGCTLAGILLTHAHVGHYAGLIHLGREVMGAQGIPVYATPAVQRFLQRNAPWSQLVELGYIELRVLNPELETKLSPNLNVKALRVPHRDELADTVAFEVRGSKRRLLYCPDIDGWSHWERDLRTVVDDMDVALLDGTFYSIDELAMRDIGEIPHPLVVDTAQRLSGTACDVRLIHLNHTNPLLTPGLEANWLAAQGIRVGAFGDRWTLG